MDIYNSIMKSKYYILILLIIIYFTVIHMGYNKTQSSTEVLIDVRTRTEWLINHKPGAIHIPYNRLNELELPKETKLVLYCNSGRRAKIGKEILEKRGYKNVIVEFHEF
jgi:rhodanese-related sulfurtransferase